jgi:hypothetical protein
LFKLIGLEQNLSMAYHPQTDGQSERVNQSLEQYLRIFINDRQDNWKEWLPIAEFTYNNTLHSAHQQSPFFLNYSHHPWTGKETMSDTRNKLAKTFAEQMRLVHEDAQAALLQNSEEMKNRHDKRAGVTREFSEGDLVYLEVTNLKTTRAVKKLDDKRFGPFKIEKKVGPAAYKLELPPTWPIHPVFNESLLTLHRHAAFPSQQKPPPPPALVVEGEEEYEVEIIIDSRRKRGKVEYLVHWKGYPREEETWKPVDNVAHTPALIAQFHEQYPNKPAPPGIRIRQITNAPSTSSQRDIIITITTEEADTLLFDCRQPVSLDLPTQAKRVWIYEWPAQAFTFMAIADKGQFIRLYQLIHPLDDQELRGKYGKQPPCQRLYEAFSWLRQDFANRLFF